MFSSLRQNLTGQKKFKSELFNVPALPSIHRNIVSKIL